ncbi:MAG: hypothetical protein WD669_05785 [Pirellulales bacterium]
MVRRILLALACVAVLGAAGLGATSTASAHGGGNFRPFGYGFAGPGTYSIGYGGYGNAGLAMGAYGPFVQSYPVIYNRYPVYYGGHGHHGHRHRGHGHHGHGHHGHGGLSISVRF